MKNKVLLPLLLHFLYGESVKQFFPSREVGLHRTDKQRLAEPTGSTEEIIFPLIGQSVYKCRLIDIHVSVIADTHEVLYSYRVFHKTSCFTNSYVRSYVFLCDPCAFARDLFLARIFFYRQAAKGAKTGIPLSVAFAFFAPLRETFLLIFTFLARFSDRADYPAPSNGVHHESRALQENNKNQLFSVLIDTTKVWTKSTTTLLSTRCAIFHITCHQ